jgi:hypothetical protein
MTPKTQRDGDGRMGFQMKFDFGKISRRAAIATPAALGLIISS